jgi:predicted lipoprotein with Yx(FWY)xxD motif
VVRVSNNPALGRILVDSKGRTLYLFTKDSGKKSACVGVCATPWPPLLAHGTPKAGSGASLVSTTRRSGGASQVTYNGHPLYTFIKDKRRGDTNGEGVSAFGGSWFAVSPSGARVSSATPAKSQPRPAAPKPQPPPAAPKPQPRPAAPVAPPAAKPQNTVPQNGGGDGDADNSGGPDDGDGGV